MATTIKTMQRYADEVMGYSRVQEYVGSAAVNHYRTARTQPRVVLMPEKHWKASYGADHCAGVIRVQPWLLADVHEARALMRHELAHFLNYIRGDARKKPHGKEFKAALKVIDPQRHKTALHWYFTPKVEAAMEKLGIPTTQKRYGYQSSRFNPSAISPNSPEGRGYGKYGAKTA